eukprot:6411429-Pyramimonas_sp.AAC.1
MYLQTSLQLEALRRAPHTHTQLFGVAAPHAATGRPKSEKGTRATTHLDTHARISQINTGTG